MKLLRSTKPGPRNENMGARNGIYFDVDGAPFKIGDKVKVVCLADETAARKFLKREGTVLYFEYVCGCGQRFPRDPMIGVQFPRSFEEFWKEELCLINRPRIRPAKKLSRRAALIRLRKLTDAEHFKQITSRF